ncbi:hypothetical protein J7E87_07165 [Streptomyces sp. ISL-1]|uniref:hypothetical protein n=1 Tax=Streptomyces sp. ISL-1 TaxID=2817657 RepID=UPI001BED3026|nr:hypothetical protein [Streptomyces sp. ISL-1]MBT2389210.1 hypothetical protein [Streptomyces sp. ISL-1]
MTAVNLASPEAVRNRPAEGLDRPSVMRMTDGRLLAVPSERTHCRVGYARRDGRPTCSGGFVAVSAHPSQGVMHSAVVVSRARPAGGVLHLHDGRIHLGGEHLQIRDALRVACPSDGRAVRAAERPVVSR